MTIERFLAFSCMHVPYQDDSAVDWLLQQIESHKPDTIVCLGDVLDAAAASRFAGEHEHSLIDEYKQTDAILQRIRDAAYTAKLVWCMGNHEDNLMSENRIPKDLRELTCFRNHMAQAGHWQTLEYRYNSNSCVYRIGQVAFYHGFKFGDRANDDHCIQFGDQWGLTVMGHTHRPEPVTRVRVRSGIYLKQWFANVGTLCDFDQMRYASRRNTEQWGQGCIVGEAMQLKSPRRGRYWDAEVRIRKMAWDGEQPPQWKTMIDKQEATNGSE